MRCLNCQTVLMDGDARCPMCGAHTDPNAGSTLVARAEYDPAARQQLIRTKWTIGLLAPPIGLLLLLYGGRGLYDTYANPPTAREVSAAELLDVKQPKDMPGWISYLPPKEAATGVGYRKLRSGTMSSEFILLQVRNRWLLAKVRPNATGFRVEGQLDTPDHLAVGMLPPNEASKLLPVMLDAETSLAISRRQDYIIGGVCTGFGALLLILGISSLFMKVPAPAGEAPRIQGIQRSSVGNVPLSTQARTPIWVGPDPEPSAAGSAQGCLLPAVFSIVWSVAFFIGGMVVIVIFLVATGDGDPAKGKELGEQAGKTVGPWLILGSVLLALVLGFMGKLPGTRR